MSKVPDAWEDEWSSVADTPSTLQEPLPAEPKKTSSKVTKAQKRAQQAEFNRQLWAEAEGPKQTNFFLESRNVVPLRQEFKPPTVLLSRKGPITQTPRPPVDGMNNLSIAAAAAATAKEESSEDEDEETARKNALAERQAQAAKDREIKQRKYEERRLELFGPQANAQPQSRSGNSSPGSSTPPQSRSTTPSQRGKRGRGRGQFNSQAQPRIQQRDLFDHSYSPKPDSIYVQRRGEGQSEAQLSEVLPIRAPKGPDGSGKGGFGFASRAGNPKQELNETTNTIPSS